MKYVCEPFTNQVADLQAELKTLQGQLLTADGEEKTKISKRLAEVELEIAGMQQSLADCLARPEHFKEEPPDPRDPRKR